MDYDFRATSWRRTRDYRIVTSRTTPRERNFFLHRLYGQRDLALWPRGVLPASRDLASCMEGSAGRVVASYRNSGELALSGTALSAHGMAMVSRHHGPGDRYCPGGETSHGGSLCLPSFCGTLHHRSLAMR